MGMPLPAGCKWKARSRGASLSGEVSSSGHAFAFVWLCSHCRHSLIADSSFVDGAGRHPGTSANDKSAHRGYFV